MPPNQSRSAGAFRIAEISAVGSSEVAVMPSASRISSDSGMVLAERGKTPPPGEIRLVS